MLLTCFGTVQFNTEFVTYDRFALPLGRIAQLGNSQYDLLSGRDFHVSRQAAVTRSHVYICERVKTAFVNSTQHVMTCRFHRAQTTIVFLYINALCHYMMKIRLTHSFSLHNSIRHTSVISVTIAPDSPRHLFEETFFVITRLFISNDRKNFR